MDKDKYPKETNCLANNLSSINDGWSVKHSYVVEVNSEYWNLLTNDGTKEVPAFGKAVKKSPYGKDRVIEKAFKLEKLEDGNYKHTPSIQYMKLFYPRHL